MNMVTLKPKTRYDTGKPLKLLILNAIPVVPPVISPDGRRKKATPAA